MSEKVDSNVTEAEMRETLSGPAVYSNFHIIERLDLGMRITFMEKRGDGTHFRASVLLSYADSGALHETLTAQLRRYIESADPAPAGKETAH